MQQKKNAHLKPDVTSWQRENFAGDFIPYLCQINENTVKTKDQQYLQVIKLEGVAHESADADDIDLWKKQLQMCLQNLCSNNIAVWTTTIRREQGDFPRGQFKDTFVDQLNNKYKKHMFKNRMMVNDLYLTILIKDDTYKKIGPFSKKPSIKRIRQRQKIMISQLNDLSKMIVSSLDQFHPEILSVYHHNNKMFSDLYEFLDYLVNFDRSARVLTQSQLANTLTRNRCLFGKDFFQINTLPNKRFGAILSIFEYPESSDAGLLNSILSSPFDLIISQSFNFFSKPVGLELLRRQQRRMIQSDDLAVSQTALLDVAIDDLASGRMVMGEHHISITIITDSKSELNKAIASMKTNLADAGIIATREDWGLASAFWSQLPGNFKYRTRPAPITSNNFVGFSSFHNYPIGHISGNQWGPSVTMFKTSSSAPYYFSFHEALDSSKARKKAEQEREFGSDSLKEEKEEQKALGNTLIIGPSGSGKTVVQGFLMAQSKKFLPTQVIFDKDRGLEIFVRANRGVYLPILKGQPTGFNPFKLDKNSNNLLFLKSLLTKLCGELTLTEEKEIVNAIDGVFGLPRELRTIERCLDFLDPVDSEGAYTKLEKWCGSGANAWVFDNQDDQLNLDNADMFGFDVTEFIDDDEVRTPIIMYLFHRIESLIDGRRFMVFLDEFWKLLLDDFFEDFAQNKQKVIRKQNGIMVYGTQSAKDVLQSPIAHTLIEQCATFIFMPNAKADAKDYIEGFHLTQREYEIIRYELTPGSRCFLIKQGHDSVVAELNLKGFDDELAIISGTTENVNLLEKVIQKKGEDPDQWMEYFHEKRKN